MNSTCINYYQKTLEGLALYFANLNFNIEVNIDFGDKFLRKHPSERNYRYEHFIEEYKLQFRPKFSTFFNENECLIKILIPNTYLSIGGKYVSSGNFCSFKVLALNENFLTVKIVEKDLDKMSLDFNVAYSRVLNKIKIYCDNELSKLNSGLINDDKKWIVKADYNDLSLHPKYSY